MANLPETPLTWESGIYQLEVTDKVDAGIGGAGLSNLQAKQLANRTSFLKNKIRFNQDFSTPVVVGSGGSNFNFDNVVFANTFPLPSPFYTTPNDGVTRNFLVTMTFFADFTYNASGNIIAYVYTITSGPLVTYLLTAKLRQPFQSLTYSKVVSLPPNTTVKAMVGNNATGANATFTELSLSLIEL